MIIFNISEKRAEIKKNHDKETSLLYTWLDIKKKELEEIYEKNYSHLHDKQATALLNLNLEYCKGFFKVGDVLSKLNDDFDGDWIVQEIDTSNGRLYVSDERLNNKYKKSNGAFNLWVSADCFVKKGDKV